jgi:hypothetical protein
LKISKALAFSFERTGFGFETIPDLVGTT